MEQRSPEWHLARVGKLTASRVADATARIKGGWGASRADYMAELLVERLTGAPAPHYTNQAMEHGTAFEGEAREAYEFEFNAEVVQVGFIPHPSIANSGASPDGLVGDDGLVETKCPNTATHIETLLGAPIDGKYIKQMQWQMSCTGRKWCDWVSYDPRMPLSMRFFCRRIERDDAMIAQLEEDAKIFLQELDTKHRALLDQYENARAA
jgi:putative phage-type endonuclease